MTPTWSTAWTNTETFNGSDHAIISMVVNRAGTVERKWVQNIAKTDWKVFLNNLPTLPQYQVSTSNELENRAELVVNNIEMAFSIACPPKLAYPGKPCKWWTPTLTRLLRKKNLAARIARRFKGTPKGLRHLSIKRSLGNLFQKTLRQEKSNSWKNFTTNLEGYRNIATLFKNLKHQSDFNIPLLKGSLINARNALDNLEILRSTHFNNSTTNFAIYKGNCLPLTNKLDESLDRFLSQDLLDRAIDSLPNGKSPGADGIKNEVIKRLPSSYRIELLSQFKSSVLFSFIPTPWLKIKTIFIKKEVIDLKMNQRPIDLLA